MSVSGAGLPAASASVPGAPPRCPPPPVPPPRTSTRHTTRLSMPVSSDRPLRPRARRRAPVRACARARARSQRCNAFERCGHLGPAVRPPLRPLGEHARSTHSSPAGMPGDRARGAGGSSEKTFSSTETMWSPVNGRSSHALEQHAAQREDIRARRTSRDPRACSGAMYPGVPSIDPVRVSAMPTPRSRATPKSRSVTSRTSGREEEVARLEVPVHTPARVHRAERARRARPERERLRDRQRARARRSVSVSPSSHSIARYAAPTASPRARCTAPRRPAGGSRAPVPRARTAAARFGSCAPYAFSLSTLTAIVAPVCRSRVRYTSPIPPEPARRSTSNRSAMTSPARIRD